MEEDPDKTWIVESAERTNGVPPNLPKVHKTPVIPPSKADIKFMEAWNTRQPVVYPYKRPELEITVTRHGSNQEEPLVLHSTPMKNAASGRLSKSTKRKRRAGSSKSHSSDTGSNLEQEQSKIDNMECSGNSGELNTQHPVDPAIGDVKPGSVPSPITLVFEDETKSHSMPKKDQQTDSTQAQSTEINCVLGDNMDKELPKEVREILSRTQCPRKCSCCVKGAQIMNRILNRCSTDIKELSVEKDALVHRVLKLETLYQKVVKEKDALSSKLKRKEAELGSKEEKIRELKESMQEFLRSSEKTTDNFSRLLDQVDELGENLESLCTLNKDREQAWEQIMQPHDISVQPLGPNLMAEIQDMNAQLETIKLRLGLGKIKDKDDTNETVKEKLHHEREKEFLKENIKPAVNMKDGFKNDTQIAGSNYTN